MTACKDLSGENELINYIKTYWIQLSNSIENVSIQLIHHPISFNIDVFNGCYSFIEFPEKNISI